ncbi:hypothetical protein DCAR_0623801 [Daucus carota subsp. sativus]|uniref:Uncharacterized protein n=1 Tax=Daucus carota subsp. sativus TaxID=79200 RepID=A0A161XCR8_DAUCS|nr:hypothetical protein DCAR_0623801 [Daucus carota subsp. sativus]
MQDLPGMTDVVGKQPIFLLNPKLKTVLLKVLKEAVYHHLNRRTKLHFHLHLRVHCRHVFAQDEYYVQCEDN